MTSVPQEIVNAASQLNSHARAWGCGKRAIYAYKTFVACEFATSARPVQVLVKCHHCNGTGVYRGRYSSEAIGHCYRCTRGVATLRFVESAIGDCRWHHPYNAGGDDVLRCVWGIVNYRYHEAGPTVAILADGTERKIDYQPAEGWGPNMPGAAKLPIGEAVDLLNCVEAWLPGASMRVLRAGVPWRYERALHELPRYRLHLEADRAGAGWRCWRCDKAEDLYGNGCGMGGIARGYYSFARPICNRCYAAGYRFPTEPDPELLTPAVKIWRAHPLRQVPFKPSKDWHG